LEELLLELLDEGAHEFSTAAQRSELHWHAEDVNGAEPTPVRDIMAQLPEFPILAP